MVSMGTVWDRTTEFLGDKLGTVLPLAGVAILVPTTIGGAIAPLREGAGQGTATLLSLLSLACSIVSLWGQLAIIAMALDRRADPAAAGRMATRRLPAMIGIALVLLLATIVLVLPIGVLAALGGVDLSRAMAGQEVDMSGMGPGAGLYAIGVSILLLWLLARLAVLSPVVVEEARGLGAIPRAFALTRGLALKIVGILILFGVVLMVATLAARTVFGSVLRLAAGPGSGLDIATVLTAVVSGAVTTAFVVLASVYVAKLYLACREARDTAIDRP